MSVVLIDWKILPDGDEKRHAYYASREWAERKAPVMHRANGRCERCKQSPIELVHHLTYLRLYREEPSDLQGLCRPCHAFTHGKSEIDPAYQPPRFMGRVVRSVYLAGTCEPRFRGDGIQNWRASLTDAYFVGHKLEVSDRDQVVNLSNGKNLGYGGPYIHYDHGCESGELHGFGWRTQEQVLEASCKSILSSDLIFAWIDRSDSFGTLAEIGFARATDKLILVGGPKEITDLWFATSMADQVHWGAASPRECLEKFVL